ncbi:hypothetical protein OEZ85_013208 [Tetradesmus obliquus]|uniref:MYND-type domain-containing protein n=1 Tax=Tetradesmus obliquus TaxID=3088 RepID=A0ABY8U7Y6_TETOB|nr:hypothetical protein OEZ85_013208 [Tetradesmus obliquus]
MALLVGSGDKELEVAVFKLQPLATCQASELTARSRAPQQHLKGNADTVSQPDDRKISHYLAGALKGCISGTVFLHVDLPGTARYCSKACQVAHHPVHRKICKSIAASTAT